MLHAGIPSPESSRTAGPVGLRGPRPPADHPCIPNPGFICRLSRHMGLQPATPLLLGVPNSQRSQFLRLCLLLSAIVRLRRGAVGLPACPLASPAPAPAPPAGRCVANDIA